jgi:hypothetical protein
LPYGVEICVVEGLVSAFSIIKSPFIFYVIAQNNTCHDCNVPNKCVKYISEDLSDKINTYQA